MPQRKRDDVLEIADLVEGLMLQGYQQPSQIARQLKTTHQLTTSEARHFVDHVLKKWARGHSRQDRDTKRARLVEMNMQALRQSYQVFAQAKNSLATGALGEANRALANIRGILSQIADLEGVKERTMRFGGDKENIPIVVEEHHTQIHLLETMFENGSIDASTADGIKQAILARRNRDGEEGSGSLRMVDAASYRLPSPSGDHPGGQSEESA